MGDELTNEERNEIMDRLIHKRPDLDGEMFGTGFSDAIRECDRKARAWDALEGRIKSRTRAASISPVYRTWNVDLLQEMTKLLAPPKPKNKLDRLAEFAKTWPQMVPIEDLINEIESLKEEVDAEIEG
jgi:hypothetical protein